VLALERLIDVFCYREVIIYYENRKKHKNTMEKEQF
jgi:hypothetical protein